MKITIKVTKDVLHRTALCAENPGRNCAIAYAVREIFPMAHVCTGEMYFDVRNQDVTTHLPIEAQYFITRFDEADAEERVRMSEFSFQIDVPEEVVQQIGLGEVYRILSESRTLELATI